MILKVQIHPEDSATLRDFLQFLEARRAPQRDVAELVTLANRIDSELERGFE